MKKYLLLLAICWCFISCGPNYILDKKIDFQDNQWTYADSISFEVDIVDSEKLFNCFIDIEHLTEYSFQNLYIRWHMISPDGTRETKQISIPLLEKTGIWKGNCNSDECDFRYSLQQKMNFDKPGKYSFSIEQFMRKNPLEGIQSVAFRIEDIGEKIDPSTREK